jgi:transcriptional regulator with XRE-family HTH domain
VEKDRFRHDPEYLAARLLREIRELSGLSLSEAARKVNRSASSLSRAERGENHVDLRTLAEYFSELLEAPEILEVILEDLSTTVRALREVRYKGGDDEVVRAIIASFLERYR